MFTGEVLDMLYIRESSELCVLDSKKLSIYDIRFPLHLLRLYDHYSTENSPNRLFFHTDKLSKFILSYSTKRPGSIFSFPIPSSALEDDQILYNLLYSLNTSSTLSRSASLYSKSIDSVCNYNPCSSIKGAGVLQSLKGVIHTDSEGGLYITLPHARVDGLDKVSLLHNPVLTAVRDKVLTIIDIQLFKCNST